MKTFLKKNFVREAKIDGERKKEKNFGGSSILLLLHTLTRNFNLR